MAERGMRVAVAEEVAPATLRCAARTTLLRCRMAYPIRLSG